MEEQRKRQKVLSQTKEKKTKRGAWIFMFASLFLFLILFVADKDKGVAAFTCFYQLLLEILPFLVLVFLLMVLVNLFLTPAVIKKHLGENSGIKGWILSIAGGIISLGAVYMWFPLLKDLMNKGVKPGLVAVFLYNRGIKLHWLPLMSFYFGVKYVVILTAATVFASVLQGVIIDGFFKRTGNA